MKDQDFKKLLEFGKKYESELLKYINYDKYKISDKSAYDIKCYKNDKFTKYEVKADKWANISGNICIEYKSNNILSGISITQAKYYAIFQLINETSNKYILYVIPTKKIKEMIQNKLYHRDLKCGYNGLSQCYLFKTNLFNTYIVNQDLLNSL
jgi:hypothetical protein